MKVDGKINIKFKTIKDLQDGEIFYFISKAELENISIWMRCSYTNEIGAVNLETGICYNFNGDELVQTVDGKFIIMGGEFKCHI